MTPNFYMEQALVEARRAAGAGEVPVGAVLVLGDEVISLAHNETERLCDASAHAEILAIRRGSEKIGNWRLSEASLFVTLEPCTMCIGAMVLARVKKLYFGAYDPRLGAVGSLFDLSAYPKFPHHLEVFPELLADKSAELLKEFFSKRRGEKLESA